MNELEQLTSLLGGTDKNRLNRLERQLDDTYQRTQDIAKILPAVLRTLHDQDNLVEALQEPVDSCIKKSMQQEPRSFVKAILPVISPLILDTATNVIKPLKASVQEQQGQFDSIKKFLKNLEQAYVSQQDQLQKVVKQSSTLEQTHVDQIKDLYASLQIQNDHLEKLVGYFDKLEKTQIKQHLQLDSLKKNITSLFAKNKAEQHNQSNSIKNLIRDVLQKLKARIDKINKQVDNVEQNNLKRLLEQNKNLEQFQQRYIEFEERILDPQKRTQDIANILPDAIRQASEINSSQQTLITINEAELAESLQEPVELCFQQSIRQDTETFANVLFPIMGPAIRKSINESFKVIVQRINKTLEESLSPKGIVWRLQSLRTGQPFADIVLQQTLVFEVEQVFLMHRESGLLIQHLHKDGVEVGDSDAVSAMFTAIQDFVRDSFISNTDSTAQRNLNTVEVGERTVWLEHSPYAVLACVIHGDAPVDYRKVMQNLLETMHARYGVLLQEFSGDNRPLQPCRTILQKAIHAEKKSQPTNWRLQLVRVGGIVGLISLALFVWGYYAFLDRQRLNNYLAILQDTPGILVVSSANQDGKLVIHGMRDPLAKQPDEIARQFDLSNKEVVFKETSYQDLNAQFVEQRLHKWLKPPATVKLQLKKSKLSLSGHASQAWIDKAINNASTVAGVNQVETHDLFDTDDFLLQEAKHELKPSKNIALSVQDQILQVTGKVDSATFQTLQQSLRNFQKSQQALASSDTSGLVNIEHQRYELIQTLEKTKIYFAEDATTFIHEQEVVLQNLRKNIQQLLKISQELDQSIHIHIIGDTDGLGTKIYNQQLSQRRAEIVSNWLQSRGIEKSFLLISYPLQIRFGESKPNQSDRNVTFLVKK